MSAVYHENRKNRKLVAKKPCIGCTAYDKKLDKCTPDQFIHSFLPQPDGWILHSRFVDAPFDDFPGSSCYYYCNPKCVRCVANSESLDAIKYPEISLKTALEAEKALDLAREQKMKELTTLRDLSEKKRRDEYPKECEKEMIKRIQKSRDTYLKKHIVDICDFREPHELAKCPHSNGCVYCGFGGSMYGCEMGLFKYRKFWRGTKLICDGCPVSMYNFAVHGKHSKTYTQPGFSLYTKTCEGCLSRKSQMHDVIDVI